ncbi:MAG: hypothetical protein ABI182_02210, partial [Candidatus Baltobacteraceae bacterium]
GLGRLWYIAMLGAAIVVARGRIARRAPEFAVLAAGAFAVTLGPFVHLDHIALAIPAGLWLASHSKRPSIALVMIVVALAIPLLYVLAWSALIVVVAPVTFWAGSYYLRNRDAGLRPAAIVVLAIVAIELIVVRTGTGQVLAAIHSTIPVAVSEHTWGSYIRANNVMSGWSLWLVKLPTWYGLVGCLVASLVSSFRRD